MNTRTLPKEHTDPRRDAELLALTLAALPDVGKRLKAAEPKPLPSDPWEFCVECCYTFDENAVPGTDPHRRFPEKKHLLSLVREWESNPLLHVKKSSQIMVTWLFCGLYLWKALQKKGTRVAWFCLTRPQAAGHIKARAFRIYENIPRRFQKPLAIVADGTLSVYHDGDGTLPTAWLVPMAAETDKREEAAKKMRSQTWTDAYLDEAEFYPQAMELIHSLLGRCERLLAVSTPNGDTYVNRLG